MQPGREVNGDTEQLAAASMFLRQNTEHGQVSWPRCCGRSVARSKRLRLPKISPFRGSSCHTVLAPPIGACGRTTNCLRKTLCHVPQPICAAWRLQFSLMTLCHKETHFIVTELHGLRTWVSFPNVSAWVRCHCSVHQIPRLPPRHSLSCRV